jgi:hypothetical protein
VRHSIEDAEYEQEQQMREREYQRERGESNRERAQRWYQDRLTFRTRAQWREAGRMVIAGDREAKKTVIARSNGNTLYLFSEDQTRERTKEELLPN